MKRKAFGFIAIFLVMFQLFSPWMVNISDKKISLQKNEVLAATKATAEIDLGGSQPYGAGIDFVAGVTDASTGEFTVTVLTDPRFKVTAGAFTARDTNSNEIGKKDIILDKLSQQNIDVVGYRRDGADARMYLKNDYVINDARFDPSKITSNGYYQFSLTILDTVNNKEYKNQTASSIRGEEEDDFLKDRITDSVGYILAQKGTGNNFDIKWGIIRNKDTSAIIRSKDLTGTLVVTGKSDDKSFGPDINTQSQETVKVKFAQDNKEHDLYLTSLVKSFDTTTLEAYADKHYDLRVDRYDPTFLKSFAAMTFDPSSTAGAKASWVYFNSATKTKLNKFFTKADWEFRDYSIIEENTKPALDKDGKPVLDIEIALYISKHEGEDFEEYKDVGTDVGKVDSKDQPNDWSNFMKDGATVLDTRKAEDRDGFTLVYSSTEKNPTVDNKEGDVNLNEYLFGEKIFGSPVMQGKDGMTFITSIPVELGKTYNLRLYARDNDSVKDDYGYTDTISITIPTDINQITQSSRSGILTGSGEELNNADPVFLPKCGVDWPVIGTEGASLTGCVIQIFYYIAFVPTAYLLGAAGAVLDFVLAYSISPDAYKAQYIVDSWRFIRDVCNLFFIFMLIYLAFKLILNVGHGTKQLIVNTLIVATVINFSYPLTTVIIDISNITARQLYYNAFQKNDADGKPVGLSATAAEGYNPQKIIIDGMSSNSSFNPDEQKGTVFTILLMGVVFNIVAIFMFLKIALQFIYRIVGLIFAIILSPIAVFSFSLDGEQRKKLKLAGFDQWMSGLLQDAFKAPVFLFFIMIMALFVANNPFKAVFGPDVNGIEWWASLIVPFMLIMAFLSLITSVTKSMSSSLAELAGGALMKGVGAVAGIAAGGIGLAGAGLLGKGATKLVNSGMGQRIMDRAATGKGLSGFVARQQARALRGMQTGSYDLRQNRVANAVSKETGANFNLGAAAIGLGTARTAGGYVATVENRNKKRDEFVKMLEWNKKLAEEAKGNQKALEDQKAKEEEQLAKDKKALGDKEQDFGKKDREKSDLDKVFAMMEELQTLNAKRADLQNKGEGTAEVTVKIDQLQGKINEGLSNDIKNALGGGLTITNLDQAKNLLRADKDAKAAELKGLRDGAGGIEEMKLGIREKEESVRNLDKSIKALTKAIENIKNNRKNGYAHRIRNKSGHIFNRSTYSEDKKGGSKNFTEEEKLGFSGKDKNGTKVAGTHDISEQMKDIITSVDEHSHTANTAFTAKVALLNTTLGTLAGAFTGGLGAIAVGAAAGGIAGIARSYRPDNEHYGVKHDEAEWHPHAHDNYKPPTGGGGGSSAGGDHGGGHH